MKDSSIDCICSDVLYGSGGDFGDYKDLPFTRKAVEGFYYPRIREMYRVLKDTGSMFILTDWHSEHWLRIIIEDVFGLEAYRNIITWYYNDTLKSSKAKRFACNNDFILFYAKTPQAKFFPLRIPREKAIKRGLKFHDPVTKRCLYKKDEDGNVLYRDYSDVMVDSVWVIGKTGTCSPKSSEYIDYATQKPEEIMRRCIMATTEKGDLVADFFVGSGTTPAVALKNQRNYFGCDISQKAIITTQDRLSKIQHAVDNNTKYLF